MAGSSSRGAVGPKCRPPVDWKWTSERVGSPPSLVYVGKKPLPPRLAVSQGYQPLLDPTRVLAQGAIYPFTREYLVNFSTQQTDVLRPPPQQWPDSWQTLDVFLHPLMRTIVFSGNKMTGGNRCHMNVVNSWVGRLNLWCRFLGLRPVAAKCKTLWWEMVSTSIVCLRSSVWSPRFCPVRSARAFAAMRRWH